MNGSRSISAINLVIAIFAATSIMFAFSESTIAKPSDQFKQVEPDFWRGALPRKRGLEQLKSMGVRTIVDLMDEDPTRWQKIASELGMEYVNIPLRRTRPIPPESVKQFLSIVQDTKKRPVYVHCRAGRDRTGAMIAIYRISANNWSAAKAMKEMKALGFNSMFKSLSQSVLVFESERFNSGAGGRSTNSEQNVQINK